MKILIKNISIVTQNNIREVIARGCILINGGIITHVGQLSPDKISKNTKIINGNGLVAIPGLVNTHIHLGESIYKFIIPSWKGSLNSYLETTNAIAARNPTIEKQRTLVCDYTISELIKAGTSTIAGGRTSKASERWGLRNISGYILMDSPKLKKYLVNIPLQFEQEYKKIKKLNFSLPAIFIHSLATIPSIHKLHEVASLIRRHPETRLMIHIAEEPRERSVIKKRWGASPLSVLKKTKLLGPKTVLIHGIYFTDKELSLIKKSGAAIVHCPSSNISTTDRTANLYQIVEMGIPFAIATDGIITAGSINVLEEARFCSSYHNARKQTLIKSQQFFDAITINAAAILGMKSVIGSIEVGKKADIAFLNLKNSGMAKLNPVKNIIESTTSPRIHSLMINGKWKLKNVKLIEPATNTKQLIKRFEKLGNNIKKQSI